MAERAAEAIQKSTFAAQQRERASQEVAHGACRRLLAAARRLNEAARLRAWLVPDDLKGEHWEALLGDPATAVDAVAAHLERLATAPPRHGYALAGGALPAPRY